MKYGWGVKLCYIPCHLIAAELGNDASWSLLFLHTISGCDTVSVFHGIGKRTVWTILCSIPHFKQIFAWLSHSPSQVSPDDLEQIKRYFILLYQQTSALSHENEARKQLFTQNRKMENIPPTLHALVQHVKWTIYQAGHIWGQSLIGDPEVPLPDLWGWKRVRDDPPWTLCWITLPEAAKVCQELEMSIQKVLYKKILVCQTNPSVHSCVSAGQHNR